MKALRPLVIIGFVAATLADTSAVQSPSPGTASWPPALQQVSDESPAPSPEEEMKTFFLPPGYRVELVASEPMVEDPILIDWDANGRMWVIELIGYMQDLPATNEREPSGRISVLEDTNRDGKMDKKTVFLDKAGAAAGAEGARQGRARRRAAAPVARASTPTAT